MQLILSFNSFDDIAKNGGTQTAVTISNGTGSFVNASSSKITYNSDIIGTVSIRFKIKSITPRVSMYLFDARFTSGTTGTGYLFLNADTTFIKSSGTIYVNGAASSNWVSTQSEIVVTGLTLKAVGGMNIGSSYVPGQWFSGTMELVEIYQGTLTASEVAELYKNDLYKYPSIVTTNCIFDLNPASGTLTEKYGNVLTNNGVTLSIYGGTNVLNMGSGLGNLKLTLGTTINLATMTDFSIVDWVKLYQIPNGAYKVQWSSASNIAIILVAINNALAVNFGGVYYANKILDTNGWYQCAITYTGGKVSFNINGVADTATAQTAPTTGIVLTNIGGAANGALGRLGRMQVFNRVLTQPELLRMYNSQKSIYR